MGNEHSSKLSTMTSQNRNTTEELVETVGPNSGTRAAEPLVTGERAPQHTESSARRRLSTTTPRTARRGGTPSATKRSTTSGDAFGGDGARHAWTTLARARNVMDNFS